MGESNLEDSHWPLINRIEYIRNVNSKLDSLPKFGDNNKILK